MMCVPEAVPDKHAKNGIELGSNLNQNNRIVSMNEGGKGISQHHQVATVASHLRLVGRRGFHRCWQGVLPMYSLLRQSTQQETPKRLVIRILHTDDFTPDDAWTPWCSSWYCT